MIACESCRVEKNPKNEADFPDGSGESANHEVMMTPTQGANRDLVERARRGDRRAQQALWRTHRRWIATIVLAHRPRAVDVEDLMQDVALKLVDKIDTLRDAAAFRPWLRQIILNVCRGAARQLRKTLSLDYESESQMNGHAATTSLQPCARDEAQDEVIARRDTVNHMLNRALGLPPEYREPLLLRCVQSMSYQQISELLGLPVTTIETRLARARRILREEVEAEADPGDNPSRVPASRTPDASEVVANPHPSSAADDSDSRARSRSASASCDSTSIRQD